MLKRKAIDQGKSDAAADDNKMLSHSRSAKHDEAQTSAAAVGLKVPRQSMEDGDNDAVGSSFSDDDVNLPENRSGATYEGPDSDANSSDNTGAYYSVTTRWRFRVERLVNLHDDLSKWSRQDFHQLVAEIPPIPPQADYLFTDGSAFTNIATLMASPPRANCEGLYHLIWGETDSLASELQAIRTLKDEYDTIVQQSSSPALEAGDDLSPLSSEQRAADSAEIRRLKEALMRAKEAEMRAKEAEMRAKEAEMRAKAEMREAAILEKAGRILDKAGRILGEARWILERHAHVRSLLYALGRNGNETGGVSTISSSARSFDPQRINKERRASPSKCEDLSDPALEQSLEEELIKLSNEKGKELHEFQDFVTNLIGRAEIVSGSKEGCKLIENTVRAIVSYPRDPDFNSTRYGRPAAKSLEREADQPILYAIIYGILGILGNEYVVTEEQVVPNAGRRPARGRRVDFTVHQIAEHLAAIFPAMLQRVIEVKVVGTGLTQFGKYQDRAKDQIVGHLSRRLLYSFDFGGVGADENALGVSLTVASLTVYELKLAGVGTENVALKARKTKCLPLVRSDCVAEYGCLRDCAGIDCTTEDDSKGFLVLAGALAKLQSTGEPVCRCLFSGTDRRLRLEYLGSGAFCHAVKTGEDTFMKIPKSVAMVECLQHELLILSRLAHAPGCKGVPIPCEEEISQIRFTCGYEASELPCLRLLGIVGVSASVLPSIRDKRFFLIAKQVYEALTFAHKNDIFHMDVRPGNIIVSHSGTKVMLSDWGCAVEGKKTAEALPWLPALRP